MSPTADLLEMHRRMLRDPRLRAARRRALPRRRGPRLRAPVDRPGGRRRRARAGRFGPTDVITSTHRGHGHCLAKGLDPLGMFAELMAQGRRARTAGRGGSMHIADPDARDLRRQRHRRRRPADRGRRGDRRPAAGRRQRRGGVLRRRRGRAGRVPRGGEPRRGVAAAGVFFCENNGYAEFSPASTQHAAPLERARRRLRHRLRRGRRQRRRGDRGRDGGRGAGGPRRARARRRRGDHLPLARALRRRPAALPVARGGRRRGRRATRSSSTRAGSATAGVGDDEIEALESSVARELDDAVEAARRLAGPGAGDAAPTSSSAPDPARAEPPAPPADAPVFRTMDAIRAALEVELAADDRVFVAGIDVGAGGNVFGLTRGLHDRVRRSGARHADLRDRDRRPRRRRGDGRDAPGRRADVPRLPRRLPRPAAQPGGQAAVHDRRRGGRWR